MILEFGSRSGSWFALGFFAIIFAALGWGATRQIRQRSTATSRHLARAIGLLLFVGPVSLIFASSLSGFYEAEIDGGVVRLRYLVPGVRSEIPLTEIAAVRPNPWYRSRWRLQLETLSGSQYESATWHRDAVAEASTRLKQAVALTGNR